MNHLGINLVYEWQAVLTEENEEYLFPHTITPFMKTRYREPAIYRWDICKNVPEDKKLVYIGETQELCPGRVNGYLNPGSSQQTNRRIKADFESYLMEGLKLRLDICSLDKISVGDSVFTRENISDKHIRRMIEEALIVHHKLRRFTVKNL